MKRTLLRTYFEIEDDYGVLN